MPTDDDEIEALNESYAERTCRKMPHRALEGKVGVVEKIFRARRTGLIKAKVIWDNGKVTYELLYELNIF